MEFEPPSSATHVLLHAASPQLELAPVSSALIRAAVRGRRGADAKLWGVWCLVNMSYLKRFFSTIPHRRELQRYGLELGHCIWLTSPCWFAQTAASSTSCVIASSLSPIIANPFED